jgi:hypothetical protein
MDATGSFLCSHKLAIDPYSEPNESSLQPPILFKIRFNIIFCVQYFVCVLGPLFDPES